MSLDSPRDCATHTQGACNCATVEITAEQFGTRRGFMQAMGAITATAALPACTSMGSSAAAPKLIDTHHHFYPPAYQKAWFESAEPGEPTEKGTAAFVFGSRFDWEITHRIELLLEYRGQYTSRAVGETTHHGVSTLSLELTKRFDLDVSFIWDRISNPKVALGGAEPKSDDFRLVVGLGVDF